MKKKHSKIEQIDGAQELDYLDRIKANPDFDKLMEAMSVTIKDSFKETTDKLDSLSDKFK